jgi:hypothetical protein
MLQLEIYFSLMSMNIQHMVLWDVTAYSYYVATVVFSALKMDAFAV